MRKPRSLAVLCAVCLAMSPLIAAASAADSQTDTAAAETGDTNALLTKITIDGSTANTDKNSAWRGFGFVSAGNSSRLLTDYKYEKPEVYRRLLSWMFSPDGPVRMNHLKLELGADINSSGGTEPSTMRSADESANVMRGAGFRLACDAKAVNPDLTLELLSWGAPGFVRNAEDREEQFELRYKWFKETLDAAYEEYGLEFDYIDPNYSEKGVDTKWIKYFAERLSTENDTPYDYGSIKIVASDENASYNTAAIMERDKEFRDAVDVIGIHNTSVSDENTFAAKKNYGKELWYSEGIAPAASARYAVNADGSGIGGVNSLLDVAGRIVNMYPNGGFNMYAFRPAVASCYSGAAYSPKQLITANEPWSGYTEVSEGVYMCEHFSLFTRSGWQFVDSACCGDGREEDNALYGTTNNYMTLTDPDTGDYSTIFVNNTPSPRSCEITVTELKKASSEVKVWETRGPDAGGAYGSNYMKNTLSITPEDNGNGGYTFKLTVKPYSMVTASTLSVTAPDLSVSEEYERLTLPYSDDFDYADYDESYIEERGGAPRYTTDIGGAFEVVEDETGGRVLRQMMTEETRGKEWSSSPEPVTTFGDDTWSNYSISADIMFDSESATEPASNYVGVGLRYINSSAYGGKSGYWIRLSADGSWALMHMSKAVREGSIEGLDSSAKHSLSITAIGDTVSARINGEQVASAKTDKDVTFSGRGAFYSAYYRNSFDDLHVTAYGNATGYVNRTDELDSAVTYEGKWEHNTMDSYAVYNRTSSFGGVGDSVSFSFEGDSLALIGKSYDGNISVELDGKLIVGGADVRCSSDKAAMWFRHSLGYSEHDVKITVNSGSITLDAIEYGSRSRLKNGDPEGGYLDEDASEQTASEAEEEKTSKAPKRKKKSNGLHPALIGAGVAVLILAEPVFKGKKRK